MTEERCATSGLDSPSRRPWHYAHAAGIEGLHWDIYAGEGIAGWLVASVGTEADAARIVAAVNADALLADTPSVEPQVGPEAFARRRIEVRARLLDHVGGKWAESIVDGLIGGLDEDGNLRVALMAYLRPFADESWFDQCRDIECGDTSLHPRHSRESARPSVEPAGPYRCGGPQTGQPRPHTACNCTPRFPTQASDSPETT